MAVLKATIKLADENGPQPLNTDVAAIGLMFPVTDLTSGIMGGNMRRLLLRADPMQHTEEEGR